MPYSVTVASPLPAGTPYIQLPDSLEGVAGETYILTDEQFSTLNPSLFTTANNSGQILLTNNGFQGASGSVTVQGTAYTLTSTPVNTTTYDVPTTAPTATTPYGFSTAAQAQDIINSINQLITQYNQLQADVAALNTDLSGTGKALA